ncbi:hypothetical protein D3C78_1053610 [compost metagenome]
MPEPSSIRARPLETCSRRKDVWPGKGWSSIPAARLFCFSLPPALTVAVVSMSGSSAGGGVSSLLRLVMAIGETLKTSRGPVWGRSRVRSPPATFMPNLSSLKNTYHGKKAAAAASPIPVHARIRSGVKKTGLGSTSSSWLLSFRLFTGQPLTLGFTWGWPFCAPPRSAVARSA